MAGLTRGSIPSKCTKEYCGTDSHEYCASSRTSRNFNRVDGAPSSCAPPSGDRGLWRDTVPSSGNALHSQDMPTRMRCCFGLRARLDVHLRSNLAHQGHDRLSVPPPTQVTRALLGTPLASQHQALTARRGTQSVPEAKRGVDVQQSEVCTVCFCLCLCVSGECGRRCWAGRDETRQMRNCALLWCVVCCVV